MIFHNRANYIIVINLSMFLSFMNFNGDFYYFDHIFRK